MDSTITGKLADFAHSLEWSAVPPAVAARCKLNIADTLGVMMIGATSSTAKKAATASRNLYGDGGATILATGAKSSAVGAAFANGVAAHCLLFDDEHNASMLHPGCAIIPSVMAVGEETRAAGERCLSSVLVGYEVAIRVAVAMAPSHYAVGFSPSGTANAIGTAAAVAKMSGCDQDGIATAMGMAAQEMGGLRFYQKSGRTEYAALLNSYAAALGVTAAALSAGGYGEAIPFLDMQEFHRPLTKSWDSSGIAKGLAKRWRIMETTFKPYPGNRLCHGPVSLTLEMRRTHGIRPDDIAGITVAVDSRTIEVSGLRDVHDSKSAALSIYYNVAAAAEYGKLTVAELENEAVNDHRVQQMMKKVRVHRDPGYERAAPRKWKSSVRIRTKDGKEYVGEIDWLSEGRLTPAGVKKKFFNNLSPVSRGSADSAWKRISSLEEVTDCSDLMEELPR